MNERLDVYLLGVQVAKLELVRGSRYRLEYLPEHIADPSAVPVSVHFPVVPGPYTGEDVEWFLENLLPDREDVRRRWAISAGLPTDEVFGLLSAYGQDVAGALEFYPAGTPCTLTSELDPVSGEAIAERIRQIRDDDTQWLPDGRRDHRFSLGGAQGKFALAEHDGEWFQPSGQQPSTHIFKPGVAKYDGSDVTEHIVLRVAERLGFPVAPSRIEYFEGQRTLVVERFDRLRTDESVVRLHQEDFAQATGTPPSRKYEADGGPSYRQIFAVMDRNLSVRNASNAKLTFAYSLVFSWIIGNHDGHSKNYALMLLANGRFLAPLYDLNSIYVFQAEEVCQAKDYRAFDELDLAFAVNGKRRVGEIGREEFRQLERDAGLAEFELDRIARHFADRLVPAVNAVIDELPDECKGLTPVQNFPFVAYAQTRRVQDLLGDA